MKQATKPGTRIKLTLAKESLKVLSIEDLGHAQGGQMRTTFSCGVNLCISINAC